MSIAEQKPTSLKVFTIVLLSGWLFFTRLREIPVPEKEETTTSKEFWMFIGSLVLLFSSVLISASSDATADEVRSNNMLITNANIRRATEFLS